MSKHTNKFALVLFFIGILQMSGDLLHSPVLKGIGAATAASPAPKVFTALRGYEAYSMRFFLEWHDRAGQFHSVQIKPENYRRLRGPYNRRNVFGAVLAGGPLLTTDKKLQPLFTDVSAYALLGDAVVLRELGIDPKTISGAVSIRYEPVAKTAMKGLPATLEVK